MRISKLISGSLLLCLGSVGCDFMWNVVDGSGREGHETRDVSEFTAVHVADSLQAKITVAPDEARSVEISGDDNLVPLVRTRVEAGRLVLDLPQSFGIRLKLPLVVTLRTPALTGLEARDSARATANRMEGRHVVLASHDSGEVIVESVAAESSLALLATDSAVSKVRAAAVSGPVAITAADSAIVEAVSLAADDRVTVRADDSSGVLLEGEAPVLEADLHDSSQLDAEDLTTDAVKIRASDSSAAAVCATSLLDAKLTDSSKVSYTCDPESVTHNLDDGSSLTEK